MSELRRLTDLFDEGIELVAGERDGKPILIWIAKLNPFEREEAIKDGQVARSRTLLALREDGSDERTVFEAQLVEADLQQVKDALLLSKQNDFVVEAIRKVRFDPDWRERLDIMARSAEQLADRPDDDPERKVVLKIESEYADALKERSADAQRDYERELIDLGEDALREKYREVYFEQRAFTSFTREFAQSEFYFALRVCRATRKTEEDRWDHIDCDHLQRALDERSEVARLPQALINKIRTAMNSFAMDGDTARFLDGQQSSSASSPLPEKVEASTPSTPDATSVELVGT